jgi:hypothetical protein
MPVLGVKSGARAGGSGRSRLARFPAIQVTTARVRGWLIATLLAAAGILAYSIAARARAPRIVTASTVDSSAVAAAASRVGGVAAELRDKTEAPDETAVAGTTSERALVAATAPYCVLVTDDEGRGLASAFVQWLEKNTPLVTVETDVAGRAVLASAPTSRASTTSHLLVSRQGHAPRLAAVERGHSSFDDAQRVVLAHGAELKLRILAPDGQPVQRASVRVSVPFAKLGDVSRSRAREQDGLGNLHGRDWMTGANVRRVSGLGSREWLGVSDVDGRVAFEDLPRQLGLVVDVVAEGVAYPALARLRVDRDAAALEHTLTLPALARIRGQVVERGGAPLANMTLWLVAADEPTSTRFLSPLDAHAQTTSTDATGTFAFERVAAGNWFVGLAPELERGVPLLDFPPIAALVALGPEGRDDLDLVVDRALFLRGVVVDEHDAPVAGANLIAAAEDGLGTLRAKSGSDGAFAFGPLQRGAFTVLASKTRCACAGEPVHVTADDTSVLVVLRPAAELVVECERAADGARASIDELMLVNKTGASRFAHPMGASMSTMTLDGVAQGSYYLVVRTLDGEVAFVDGIEFDAGSSRQRIMAKAAPAARLALTNDSLSATLQLRVLDREGRELDTSQVVAGEVVEITLPPGPATVERYSRAGVEETHTLELAPGARAELTFAATE